MFNKLISTSKPANYKSNHSYSDNRGGVSFCSPASSGPNLYRQGCRWLLGLPQPQLGLCAGASYGVGEGSVASAIQCAARTNVAGLDDLYEPPVSASFLA